MEDLNLRPLACEASALTAELTAPKSRRSRRISSDGLRFSDGARLVGLEPTASASAGLRSIR